MSLQQQVISLPYKHLKFVDLELNVANSFKLDKYYFVKVVSVQETRDVYLMAIQADQYPKWQKALRIGSNILEADHFLIKAG